MRRWAASASRSSAIASAVRTRSDAARRSAAFDSFRRPSAACASRTSTTAPSTSAHRARSCATAFATAASIAATSARPPRGESAAGAAGAAASDAPGAAAGGGIGGCAAARACSVSTSWVRVTSCCWSAASRPAASLAAPLRRRHLGVEAMDLDGLARRERLRRRQLLAHRRRLPLRRRLLGARRVRASSDSARSFSCSGWRGGAG